MRQCEKCSKTQLLQLHHVNYNPDEICYLCENCHKIITSINGLYSKLLGFWKLKDEKRRKVRKVLFEEFLRDKNNLSKKRQRKQLIIKTYKINYTWMKSIVI